MNTNESGLKVPPGLAKNSREILSPLFSRSVKLKNKFLNLLGNYTMIRE